MLDNFRKKDAPQSARVQSPYGQLQQALSSGAADSPKAEAVRVEAPKVEPRESARPARSSEESVSKLIVGPDIKLKGAEITDCDTLVVEGRVEASMDSRVIQIAENGVFAGKVGVDVAEIRGRFEGELTARRQLVIRATGRVSGKIRYGKVAIEEGGELSGDVAALAATKAPGATHPAAFASERGQAAVGHGVAPAPAPAVSGTAFPKPAGASH
jgi:cytoskeletal protein CcmA (bactofilin family)